MEGVTLTVRSITLDLFHAASVFQYSSTYDPLRAVFTVPEDALESVPVPSTVSDQVAPGSANGVPRESEILLFHRSVTVGGFVSSAGGFPPPCSFTIFFALSHSIPVNGPTAKIFPSAWSAISYMSLLNQAILQELKLVSMRPLGRIRAIARDPEPL